MFISSESIFAPRSTNERVNIQYKKYSMNFLLENAKKIANALPKGTQKKLSIELNMSDSAIGQYLKGQYTLLGNTPNRDAKRIEILEAAIKELEPAAALVQGYRISQLELE
jgi:hypothetical protein